MILGDETSLLQRHPVNGVLSVPTVPIPRLALIYPEDDSSECVQQKKPLGLSGAIASFGVRMRYRTARVRPPRPPK